jgi:outer membrane protein TolC
MTLAELLRAVDERNLTLEVARAEMTAAEARLGQAWAINFPVLAGQLEATHNDHRDTFDPTAGLAPLLSSMGVSAPPASDLTVRTQDDIRAAAQLRVPIINVQAWLGVGVAKTGVELAGLGVASVRDQLLLSAARAYWVAVANREMLEIQDSQLRSAIDHLRLARSRVAAGDALRIDVVRAETEVERARQDLLAAQQSFDNARDVLSALSATEGLVLPSFPPALHEPPLSDSEQAVATRADVRASHKAVELAEKNLNAAWMQFAPTVEAGGRLAYQLTDPPDLGSDDRSRWAAFVTLTVPFYNQMRYADLDAKRAAVHKARRQAEQLRSDSALEVRRARRDYVTAMAAAETAARRAALSQEAFTLTENAYKNGASTSLEVSDAQRALQSARINATIQRLQGQMALLSLLHACGYDLAELADGSE